MTPPLPRAFLGAPIAHRAYHDAAAGRPENSRAAARAAVSAGYGIEIDVQLSADGCAMVFHDYDLGRLTGETGPVRGRRAAELGQIGLTGGAEGIPLLEEILDVVGGAVPVLVEIKDQDGAMGPGIGSLESAVSGALADYRGDVAVMSFNPHTVAEMRRLAPDVPRGLVTSAYRAKDWPLLPESVRARLRGIPDADATSAAFVSHEATDLDSAHVARLRATGRAVLCWTIRSPEAEATARRIAQNVTFEGYAAALPEG